MKAFLFIAIHRPVEREDTLHNESCLDWIEGVKNIVIGNDMHLLRCRREDTYTK